MMTGIARGGPLDGEELISRYPGGLLVVDRLTGRAWLYDWTGDGFVLRAGYEGGAALDEEGRIRAADEPDYDVIAAPWLDTP